MDLILHIGTEKTATTLLQKWLADNRSELSEQGVFLSDLLGKPGNRMLVLYFQDEIDDFAHLRNIDSPEARAAAFRGFERRFAEEMAAAKAAHHTVVITSEHFHSRLQTRGEIEALRAFLARFFDRIRVVCYFREQSRVRTSLYSTGLRRALDKRFDAFAAEKDGTDYFYDYHRAASLWRDLFGREAIDFRLYDRLVRDGGDIRRDFLGALFRPVDADRLRFAVETENRSLSFLKAAAFRAINLALPFWAGQSEINRTNVVFKQAVERCDTLEVGRIRDPDGAEFRRQCAAGNRRFFEEFFPDAPEERALWEADGDDEPDPALSLSQAGDIVEELAGALSKAAAGLLERQPRDGDAVTLRRIAMKFETGGRLDREDALALMKLAARIRPDGPLIRKKIEEWSR